MPLHLIKCLVTPVILWQKEMASGPLHHFVARGELGLPYAVTAAKLLLRLAPTGA